MNIHGFKLKKQKAIKELKKGKERLGHIRFNQLIRERNYYTKKIIELRRRAK